MNFTDIILIIISSAGLLHGLLFAFYLGVFKKKKSLSNHLLALILVFMAFRIGKSVLLHFGNELEPAFIFAGLAILLLIGPLLRWYVLAMTHSNFKIQNTYFLELTPFLILFLSSFFVTKNWIENGGKDVIIIFGSVLIFIYLHLAFYIYRSWQLVRQTKLKFKNTRQTKSQKAILEWLGLLIIGLILIWVSYVLNIIEDTVPYIIGPLMYSLVIYFLSYKSFQLHISELDGNVFKDNQNSLLFDQILKCTIDEKLYLESDISLSRISKIVGKSTQNTSEVINQYAKQNFNDLINYHRIQDAKRMLLDDITKQYTISSIAFDIGFNSLSSFNAAFKKFEGTTPSAYRKSKSQITES